jgi:hypothetical protein
MSKRKETRSPSAEESGAQPQRALPANPPKPNLTLLVISFILWLAWLGFLIWLAWRLS